MKKSKKESNEKKVKESPYSVLIIDQMEYETTLSTKYSQRAKYTPPNPNLLTAFIPGTVTDIFVKVGQQVSKGENLVILEAMKMLNEIKAPYDAVVKTVDVTVGQRVTKNHVLVELE